MNNLMNNQNNFSINTRMFKCVGLLVLLATLTCVTISRAMEEKREEMVSKTKSKEVANNMLFEARTPEDVEVAIRAGADVNATVTDGWFKGWTPLHLACYRDYIEVALELIEKGAYVNSVITDGDYKGHTPFHIVCRGGFRKEFILKLIEKGANVNAAFTDGYHKGWTPLHFASNEVTLELIEKGADVNFVITDGDYKGCTPLHIACNCGFEEFVLKLIEKGADVNAINKNDWTPLYNACLINSMGIVKLLLENGSNPGAKTVNDIPPAQFSENQNIIAIIGLVSDFIKEQDKSKRDAFIKNTEKDNIKFNLDREFWNKVEFSNIKLGRIKREPLKLFERTDKYHDSNVFCELEELERKENE